MGNIRIWIWRLLILIGLGGVVFSLTHMWWSADLEALRIYDAVIIKPWALDLSNVIDYKEYFAGAEDALPAIFEPGMWLYTGLLILCLVVGLIFNKKNIHLFGRNFNLSRWLVGIGGFSYIVVFVSFYLVASAKSAAFGLPSLVGRYYLSAGTGAESSWVNAELQIGSMVALGTGIFLLIIAIIRPLITGRNKEIS